MCERKRIEDPTATIDDFRDTYIIAVPLKGETEEDDHAICASAKLYADLAKKGMVFKFWLPLDLEAQNRPEGYKALSKGSLSDCSELDSLVLVTHGNEGVVGHWPEPATLASMLNLWGLRIVNEFRIAACLVGKGDYVGRLKTACTNEGIAVKKLVAFSEEVMTCSSYGHEAIEVAGAMDWLLGKELYKVTLRGNF